VHENKSCAAMALMLEGERKQYPNMKRGVSSGVFSGRAKRQDKEPGVRDEAGPRVARGSGSLPGGLRWRREEISPEGEFDGGLSR
jgi:hypothetical protein